MRAGQAWRRIALVGVATLAAGALTWAVVAAQDEPSFSVDKAGPAFARDGEVITYTIVVTNTSGRAVSGAVLSDTLPGRVTRRSCQWWYHYEEGYTRDCDAAPALWEADFEAGAGVVTELGVRVDVGTLVFPIVNRAELTAEGVEFAAEPVTTVVNPWRMFLPVVARNAAR